MKPPPFAYERPGSVAEALDLLAEHGDEAKILAGGQSLAPILGFRLARPAVLIDVNGLAELAGLRRQGPALHIGALTRHRALEVRRDGVELAGYELLPEIARYVGHYPIRTRGTFGGSIAHGDPAAEWPMVARLLDAVVVAERKDGAREIAAADFFESFLVTALADDELVTEIRFPRPPRRFAFREMSRRHGDFAVVAVAVAVMADDPLEVRIASAGADARPLRAERAEALLAADGPTPEAMRAAAAATAADADPLSDLHGSAEYRRHLLEVLTSRALAELWPDPVT